MTENLRDSLKVKYKAEEVILGTRLKGTLSSFLKIDDFQIKLDNISPTLTGVRAMYSVGGLNFALNHPEDTIDIIVNGSPIRVKNLVDIGRVLQMEDNKMDRT